MQGTTSRLVAPDEDLIHRAQNGDSESLARLFERYQPVIFRYLYYRTGDRQAADDLTSEVFLRALRALPKFQTQTAPFQSWLYRIARNLAVDYFRKKDLDTELTENIQHGEMTPEAALENRLTHDELQRALGRLNTEQAEVIILRFILELPIAQVAQVLGKSEDAIKGLQRRSLISLREVLSK